MKRKNLITLAFITLTIVLFQGADAQVPQGFNYQAIARGADGKEIINTNISVKISILKHDISTIADPLSKVLGLRGVNFLWNTPASGMEGQQMGFIAQEAAEIVPEIVSVNNDHYSMQYGPVTALLVEAMKEQQKVIDKLSKRVEELETTIYKLREK